MALISASGSTYPQIETSASTTADWTSPPYNIHWNVWLSFAEEQQRKRWVDIQQLIRLATYRKDKFTDCVVIPTNNQQLFGVRKDRLFMPATRNFRGRQYASP